MVSIMKKISRHDIEKLADVIVANDWWLMPILGGKKDEYGTVYDGKLCSLANCKYHKRLCLMERNFSICELDYLRDYDENFICPCEEEQKQVAKEHIIEVLLRINDLKELVD